MINGIGYILGSKTNYNKHLYNKGLKGTTLIKTTASVCLLSLVFLAMNLGSSSQEVLSFCAGDAIRYASLGIFASSLIDLLILSKRRHNLKLALEELKLYEPALELYLEDIKKNSAKANIAMTHLTKAANLGSVRARDLLAYNYATGSYIQRNWKTSKEWYCKSAALGSEYAKSVLKRKLYQPPHHDLGSPPDLFLGLNLCDSSI